MLNNIQCVPDEKDSSKHEYIVYCFKMKPPLHQKKNTAYTVLKTKSRNFYDLFVCFWFLSSHSRIVHSYGDVTITGEGLQILT